MKCGKCQFENQAGINFCVECGVDLTKPAKPGVLHYYKPHSDRPKHVVEILLGVEEPFLKRLA